MLAQVSILEPAILLLRRMPRFRRSADGSGAANTFDDLPVYLDHRYDTATETDGILVHTLIICRHSSDTLSWPCLFGA